jgi:MAF protein
MALLEMPWRAAPADLAEDDLLLADAPLAALNVALAKARATPIETDEVVLAADTLVVLEGAILGKPASPDAARGMLLALRGRGHDVMSGVALRLADGRAWGAVVWTRVEMRAFSDAEIDAYIARGEPFDKAGGYAVQDAQFRPVAATEGCYLNVVGLPLCAAAAGLEALGGALSAPARRQPPCTYCTAGAPLVSI